MVRVGSRCLNHPELVPKHPTHLASSVVVCFLEVRGAATTPNECPTHLEHCDGVVRVGSLCLNHPELLHKHPTHLASSVMVRIV